MDVALAIAERSDGPVLAISLVAVGLAACISLWHSMSADRRAELARRYHPDEPPGWLRFRAGLAMWRGWIRLSPPLTSGFAIALLATWAGLLLETRWLALVAGGCWTFLVLAVFGVVLLSRPKWLIEPYLRHQPGLVAELLGADVPPTTIPGNAPTAKGSGGGE